MSLPGRTLSLRSVVATPRRLRGSCSLTRGRFRNGQRQYVVTLNALQRAPRGSHLTLDFVAPR